MTSPRTLTFEIMKGGDAIELHFDSEGAEQLIAALRRAVEQEDHQHMMTPDWGGNALTATRQGEGNQLVHHVKLIYWCGE